MNVRDLLDHAEKKYICVLLKNDDELMEVLSMCKEAGRDWPHTGSVLNEFIISSVSYRIKNQKTVYISFWPNNEIRHGYDPDDNSIYRPRRQYLPLSEFKLLGGKYRFKY